MLWSVYNTEQRKSESARQEDIRQFSCLLKTTELQTLLRFLKDKWWLLPFLLNFIFTNNERLLCVILKGCVFVEGTRATGIRINDNFYNERVFTIAFAINTSQRM